MITHSFWSWWGVRREMKRRAAELLDRVGLSHRLTHRPSELSGGEMQRAAIARALINRPRVLLADEPTGNLDSSNGQQIMQLLRELNRSEGLTIVMVTHNMELVADTDRVVKIADGKIEAEGISAAPCGAGVE
jgi:lipoprotein-releasing system ATP-binding protein